ncbi:hypothetical protein KCU90_g3229, partial [Aureobasidium melanogenum]
LARQNRPTAATGTPVAVSGYWRNVVPAFQILELIMNKDQVKGVGEQIKGKVNETVGKATDNPGKELKGDLQQAAGKVQKAYGDAKEDSKDKAKHNAP